MKLTACGLQDRDAWKKAGYLLPEFDIPAALAHTRTAPQWIHFGAGNIFRAFPAALQQKLLNEGIEKTGIVVAEGYDYEIIKKAYQPQDDLSLLVTLKANGTIEKTVIGSLAESLTVDRQDAADWARLSAQWKEDLTERIDKLLLLRDQLDGCIGCGCLSLQACPLRNPGDQLSAEGPGAHWLDAEGREHDG